MNHQRQGACATPESGQTWRTLRHSEVLQRPQNFEGVLTFDLGQNGRE